MNVIGAKQQNQVADAHHLREIFIDQIYTISDPDYLKALKKILDAGSSPTNIYQTTDKQKEAVKKGKEQITQGKFVTNQELEADEDRWLNA